VRLDGGEEGVDGVPEQAVFVAGVGRHLAHRPQQTTRTVHPCRYELLKSIT
jgi:hypothetical protein